SGRPACGTTHKKMPTHAHSPFRSMGMAARLWYQATAAVVNASGARRAEAAGAPLRRLQVLDLPPGDAGHRHDDQLGDPVARLDGKRLAARVLQGAENLPAVVAVDDAHAVGQL